MRSHALVMSLLVTTCAGAAGPPDPLPGAIRRALARLEAGATQYTRHRQCFSCHHQALTVAALADARRRGFAVPGRAFDEQVAFTLDTFRPRLADVRRGVGVGGRNTTVAYALFTLQAAGHPADATTDALVEFLLVHQAKDGSWPTVTRRPPSEGSRFTTAALALAALAHYGRKEPRVADAAARGADWVRRAKPVDTEDRTFHLRALATIGADESALASSRQALLDRQLGDGSWRQVDSHPGDAYATATALLALRQSGLGRDADPIRRGVAFLLRTEADGFWVVPTRSTPIQAWFDNGDPGGKSQFVSFLATGWAALALLDALPGK